MKFIEFSFNKDKMASSSKTIKNWNDGYERGFIGLSESLMTQIVFSCIVRFASLLRASKRKETYSYSYGALAFFLLHAHCPVCMVRKSLRKAKWWTAAWKNLNRPLILTETWTWNMNLAKSKIRIQYFRLGLFFHRNCCNLREQYLALKRTCIRHIEQNRIRRICFSNLFILPSGTDAAKKVNTIVRQIRHALSNQMLIKFIYFIFSTANIRLTIDVAAKTEQTRAIEASCGSEMWRPCQNGVDWPHLSLEVDIGGTRTLLVDVHADSRIRAMFGY